MRLESKVSWDGKVELSESKNVEQIAWRPGASTIEATPTRLQMFYRHPPAMTSPHWHAQVEVNFIMRGAVRYRMANHEVLLSEGELALFWGGLPHQMDWSSDDSLYAGAHLPLVYFFRLQLPTDVSTRLMGGATLVTRATGMADYENFPRWFDYVSSRDQLKSEHAVDELLLRLERVKFDPYSTIPVKLSDKREANPFDYQSSRSVAPMCDYIAQNFREEISSADIAAVADLHPKYAMNLFRRTTGMTLNGYVNLLRLSYAQALLTEDNSNVLRVAMDSGFGSLSAFSKSFRKLAGISPSDFKRNRGGRNPLRRHSDWT
ncbi:helix-turn-helix domain-containing protein [Rhizobium sp. ARZ01]|nr:helix-turn-helix domain-containing protein [Rhizobium sp. ARZ01]